MAKYFRHKIKCLKASLRGLLGLRRVARERDDETGTEGPVFHLPGSWIVTSHELAQKLLELPDGDVVILTPERGFRRIEIVQEVERFWAQKKGNNVIILRPESDVKRSKDTRKRLWGE